MTTYNGEGQINLTAVDGSTRTGLKASDGSYYIVLNDGSAWKGIYHPCGAFNAVLAADPTVKQPYASNGSLNVFKNNYGLYSPVSSAGIAPFVSIPTALGFDTVSFPTVPSINNTGTLATGDAGITPEAMFDLFSTARSAPTNTYYVGAGGSDANNGLTPGTKKASFASAITAGNTAAAPYKIIADGMEYTRALGPAGTAITQDCCIITASGRATVGTFDAFGTFTLDGTFTNCYSLALTNIDRVSNRLVTTGYKTYGVETLKDYSKVADATTLNATTPTTSDLWTTDASKIYIRRVDGAVPTPTNTRLFRSSVSLFVWNTPVNVYIENIDAEGGNSAATFDYRLASTTALKRVFVAKNCSAKYCGGVVNTASRGFGIESIKGLAYLYGCEGSANATDGINFHDVQGNGTQFLTVNCSGTDNGRGTSNSNNGHTSHEGCIGIDLAGYYPNNRGGSVRHVNTSKSLFAGTYSSDLGDVIMGGPTAPVAFQTDNTAVMWCDRTRADVTASQRAYLASTGTSIHLRNIQPTVGSFNGGGGTIDSY